MTRIDDWTPIYPAGGATSDSAAQGPSGPQIGGPNLVAAIHGGLMKLRPHPAAVHCYMGEGLRWIRVCYGGGEPLTPALVGEVGRTIATCLPGGPLFFNALRPYDMLFFLEGGNPASIGSPAGHFGVPLDELLRAWESDPRAAPQ